jgi:hypothetical protein
MPAAAGELFFVKGEVVDLVSQLEGKKIEKSTDVVGVRDACARS